MGIVSRASDLKQRAQKNVSALKAAQEKRRKAKQQKTKDKYEAQIRREAEKTKKILAEQRVINAKLNTASMKRKLSNAKEKKIVDKINDVKDYGNRAKRILNTLTGSKKKKHKKRKKK